MPEQTATKISHDDYLKLLGLAALVNEHMAQINYLADYGIRTLSCPATQLVAGRGTFTLWPKSEHPITIPFAWCYDLHFKVI